jgi:hypothetical protein
MSDATEEDDLGLPSLDILKSIVAAKAASKAAASSERAFAGGFDREAIESQISYAHLRGIQDHYRHKGRWSSFLMLLMCGMVVFQSTLLGLVGAGIWDFTRYDWLLPLLLGQNLAQIIGLAVFVVKALFKEIA